MTKRILLTLSAVALVFSLAACGNTSSTEESTPATTESATTESSDGETAPSSEPEEQKKFTPLTLVDNEQVTVTITDVVENDFWGYTLKVFLENKTQQELMFTTDGVSVNGFMCDPFWATSVTAGMKANEEISFSESDFEKNGIESVEEIVFTLRIYDSNNLLAPDVLEETFTVKP